MEQSAIHGRKMHRGGATTTTNNPRTAVASQSSVLSHQLGCPRVLYLAVEELRNAVIGLSHENIFIVRLRAHGSQRTKQISSTHTTVGPVRRARRNRFPVNIPELHRRNTHHCAAVGVKGHRRDYRQASLRSSSPGCLKLFKGGHGLQPVDIGVAFRTGQRLIG